MANSPTIASQTIAEAVENSLNAFNIISRKTLEAVSYDETIKCKIIDITNRDLGEYRVTDGVSTYTAYSDNTDYYNGCLVWVTVPQGNYSNQKLITGKYIESDNSEPYTYVSPLDSFIDLTSNLIEPGAVQETGLVANGVSIGKPKEIELWSIQGRQLVGYERLAIQGSFKSALKALNVKYGTYGLRLDIFGREMGTSQTSNDRTVYSIELNTNDFFGDPYNFETFYPQVKVVDISMIKCIDSMVLTAYQGQNFYVSENHPLTYSNAQVENTDLSNIWVDSPYISLGYALDKFETDTVLLYSLDSSTYASFLSEDTKERLCQALKRENFNSDEEYEDAKIRLKTDDGIINDTLQLLNKKTMNIRWVHFEEGSDKPTIIGPDLSLINNNDNSVLPPGAVLHWYHYRLEEGVKDPLAGVYWEEISSDVDDEHPYNIFRKTYYPDIELQSEKFKVIIEMPSQEMVAQSIYNSYGDREVFWDTEVDPPVNYYPEGEHLLENETYYEWVNRGLDTLEQKKMEVVTTLGSQRKLEALEDEIYEEYLAALEEAGLEATQAEANSINEVYRKKMMNIKFSLEEKRDIYVNLYNGILKALSGVTYYYSDILEFTNEDQLPNMKTFDLIRGLQLTVDDDYHGNYRIYNEEGQILSKKESQKKRTITANWTSIVTGDRGLDGIERIEWHIPVDNTMIEYPAEGIEYSAYDEYPIETQIDYDLMKSRLRTYNKEQNIYEPVPVSATNWERTKKYYIKNTTTYSPPTPEQPEFLIVRAGRTFEGHESGTEEPSSSGQVFRIKEFYNQTLVNNTIHCVVWKNNRKYEAELSLTFGPVGTNGTDYTFELEIANKVQALTAGQSRPESSVVIIPHLYDYTGQDIIQQYKNKLKYSWWSPTSSTIEIEGTSQKAGKQEYWTSSEPDGSIVLTLPQDVTIEEAQYHILYAELTNAVDIGYQNDEGGTQHITLTTFRPIPVRAQERYVSIDGADRVSYNSSGVNPSYYKDPYHIYVYYNKRTVPIEEELDEEGNHASECPVYWEVALGSDTIGAIAGSVARKFYPTLSEQNALIPPSFFLQDNGKQVAVNCCTGTGANKQILWTQPLYIYQNSYTSALLNSWDGKLTVDEESGIILSTAVGAGAKDEKNRYNGVLMGDLRGVDQTPTFGLYGYNEGVQSFGLKIDGTAFIGKSGKGQINFDGNSGRISSLSYNLVPDEPQGMLIDLDDGYVDMYGADLQGVHYTNGEEGKDYSIDEVLQYQLGILQNEIQSYNNKKQKLNEWADKVAIQRENNRINRAQSKLDQARETIAAFQEFVDSGKSLNDFQKLKWLQDHSATHLINDDVFTPHYQQSGSHVRISVTDPYFIITSENEQDLIHIGKDEYFLQTDDYISEEDAKEKDPENGYGQGFKINLRGKRKDKNGNIIEDDPDGFIEGYNFKLKGVNNGQIESSATMKDSYFELNSSGSPFLTVHYKNTDENKIKILRDKGLLPYIEDFDGTIIQQRDSNGRIIGTPQANAIYKNDNRENVLEKDLIRISKDDFYLQSWNYIPAKFAVSEISGYESHKVERPGSGVLLDLTGGKLYGHDFEISTVDSGENDTEDNSTLGTILSKYAGSYVRLSSNGDPYFRIHYQHEGYEKYPTDDDEAVKVSYDLDIINISKSAYTIASKDFQLPNKTEKKPGRGIRFDLEGDHQLSLTRYGKANKGSFIEAYSFGLDAYRPGLVQQDPTSRIRINSAASGLLDLEALNVTNKGELTVPTVNHNYLSLPSHTYTQDQIWKAIDERFTNPEAYEAMLAVREGDYNYCPIDKIPVLYYDNPLNIGGLFSVSWDGKVTMGWLEAIQGGRIGPFMIREKALYSNNGLLANGQNFYDKNGNPLTEPDGVFGSKGGVYLGRDGLSVRDKFVVYKYPINKPGTFDKTETHTLKFPIGVDSETGEIKYQEPYIYDFVKTSYYSNEEKKQYFEDLNGGVYDQLFRTVNDNNYLLQNLSFYLNGNSVLNGKTAINGNTYIMGHLQIGEPANLIGETMDKTNNSTVIYANTAVYGIFRTTGKTYVGAVDAKWHTEGQALRDTARDDRKALDIGRNAKNPDLGFYVYRNSYIAGYLKVAGSMVVGDANAAELANTYTKKKYDEVDLHGDFTAYVINSKFYGDVEVAAGFVAGSLKTDGIASPSSYKFPEVPTQGGEGTAPGSGIQAKYIFLGRNPTAAEVKGHKDVQSDLEIYANTEQWGSFIAGRQGEKIELYAAQDKEDTRDSVHSAYLKMNNEGIFIRTFKNKPFKVDTNGGDITFNGNITTANGDGETVGGSIYFYAGKGLDQNNNPKKLYFHASDNPDDEDADYIHFDGFRENQLEGSKLSISATGSFKITVKGTGGNNSTFSIDKDGMKIELKNSLNFSITGEKNGIKNIFSFDQDKILLSRGEDNKLQMDKDGTLLSSTGAKFDLTAGEDKFYMDKDQIYLQRGTANKITLNKDGTTIFSTGANFDLTAGSNKFSMNKTQILITSAAGPTATFDASGIALKTNGTPNAFLILNTTQAQMGIDTSTITAQVYNGNNSIVLAGRTDINGDCHVNGNIYANNLKVGDNGQVQMGQFDLPEGAFPSGFMGGIDGNAFGNWHVKGSNWETLSGSFILDAENDAIKWKTGDFIDASGAGTDGTSTGITISSPNAVSLVFKNGVFIYPSDKSLGNAGVTISDSRIVLHEITISNETLYFGTGPSSSSNPTGGSYYIQADGTAVLKGLKIPADGDGLTVYSITSPTSKNYIEFGSNIYVSAGIRFNENGNLNIDNSGNAVLNDLEIGVGRNRVAEISSTGSIYGKNLYITSNGQSSGTDYFSVTSDSVTVPDDKLSYNFTDSNGESRSLGDLGALAFENDIKKKFNVSDSGTETVSISYDVSFDEYDDWFQGLGNMNYTSVTIPAEEVTTPIYNSFGYYLVAYHYVSNGYNKVAIVNAGSNPNWDDYSGHAYNSWWVSGYTRSSNEATNYYGGGTKYITASVNGTNYGSFDTSIDWNYNMTSNEVTFGPGTSDDIDLSDEIESSSITLSES